MTYSQAISVHDLGKRYRLPTLGSRADYQMLSERLASWVKWPFGRRQEENRGKRTFWALRGVDFDVKPGEAIGVIGRNGAGKSTLLKLLSRITRPTSGHADLRGRVGSLLEVGTGFHPELTGRENVFLNGGILGMTRREIRRQFDAIVEFSGVEAFLDLPVKRYSSGMRVRLAFAVAAHLEPEILVIDEVLAVGDIAFQQKCMSRMSEVSAEGRTVLFVSHNMPAIESLCERSLMLEGGELIADGETSDVISQFVDSLRLGHESKGMSSVELSDHPNRRSECRPILQHLRLLDQANQPAHQIPIGQPVVFEINYANPLRRHGLGFAFFLCSEQGQRLAMFHSRVHAKTISDAAPEGLVRCEVHSLPFLPGNYRIDVAVGSWDELIDYVDHAATLQILPADALGSGELPNSRQGLLALPSSWSIATAEAAR